MKNFYNILTILFIFNYNTTFCYVNNRVIENLHQNPVLENKFEIDRTLINFISPSIFTNFTTTIPPVAVINPMSCHPVCDSVQLDGSGSYDLDPSALIADWTWEIETGNGYYHLHGKRPTIPPNLFPTTAWYKIQLRVTDNSDPPLSDIITDSICITGPPHPPIAVPLQRPKISYNGLVNSSVMLDASGSYDPDGTSITKYLWCLRGKVNCSGSGQGFDTATTSPYLPYTSDKVYHDFIGLRVVSGGDTSIVQYAPIIFSNDDLAVDFITATHDCQDSTFLLNVSVHNDIGSSKDFQNVLLNFWSNDPRTTGKIVSKDTLVNLTRGSPVVFNIKIHYTPDLEKVYVFLDANEQIDEWNESNNIAAVYIPRIAHTDYDTVCQNSTNQICVTCNDEIKGLNVNLFSLIQPAHGTAGIISDSSISYDPDPGYYGEDTLLYVLKHNILVRLCYDTAYVYLHVSPSPVTDFHHSNLLSCASVPVTFTDSSIILGCSWPVYKWKWNFDDPGSGSKDSSSFKDTIHQFTGPGTYNVKLTVTNNFHCSNSRTKTLVLQNYPPHAYFYMDPPFCMHAVLNFYDTSTSPLGVPLTKWIWKFGDGTVDTIKTAPGSTTHVFNKTGNDTIQLKVTNQAGCTDSTQKVIFLNAPPQAGFHSVGRCVNDSIQFIDQSLPVGGSQITSYYWNFNDPGSTDNTSILSNPKHLFTNAGSYNIKHTVTNVNNCSDTIIIPTVIHSLPGVDFTWNWVNNTLEIQFHIDSMVTPLNIIGNMIIWNFGDGSFGSGHNPVHIFPVCGTFNVILTVTDTFGCSNSMTHPVIVPCLPVAYFTTNSPQCFHQPICFTDHSTGPPFVSGFIKTWIWNFGDGTPQDTIYAPANPNVCHIYATIGSFLVHLLVIDNINFSNEDSAYVTVLPIPEADFTASSACEGSLVNFTDASSKQGGGNIVSWDWNFDDPGSGTSDTSSLENPSHIYFIGNTFYNVRLIIKNINNCRDTITKAIFVFPLPPVDFTYDTGCLNQITHFNGNSGITHIDSIVSWTWNFGDLTPLVHDPVTTSHLYAVGGSYTTVLTVMDHHGCINSKAHMIKVNPVPTADFSFNTPVCEPKIVQFTDQSSVTTGFLTRWEWNFGDGAGDTITTPPGTTTHIFHKSGYDTIQLKVTNDAGCTDSRQKILFLYPTPQAGFRSEGHCVNDTIQFYDESLTLGGSPIVSYYWDFDNPGSLGNTSTLKNPRHFFTNSGSFNVSLVVTNESGCSDTILIPTVIHSLPPVDYTWNPGNQNLEMQFHVDSTVTDLTMIGNMMLWNFGDDHFGYGHNPVHIFTHCGTFQVTLSVTDTLGCTNSIVHAVPVPCPPVAYFSTNSPQCFGQPICFTDLSTVPSPPFGFIKTWIWTFGDGTPKDTIHFPDNQNICHTYTTLDSFPVNLKVIDNSNYYNDYTALVKVIPNPAADFVSTIACQNMLVNFTDASTQEGGGDIASWHWNFGDPGSGTSDTSDIQDPSHIFIYGDSSFNVRLIIVNFNNCRDTIIKTIYVFPEPPVDFTFDSACLNQPVHFNSNTGITNLDSIVSWSWDFGDGTPPDHHPVTTSHIYVNIGAYISTLTVSDHHGCAHDMSHSVKVNPLPVPNFSWASPACQGIPLQFTDHSLFPSGYNGYVAKWKWHFDDGTPDTTITIPDSPDVVHTFVSGTSAYNVRLTVWSGDSCTAMIEQMVTTLPHPVAAFHTSPTTCQSQEVQFTDDSQTNGGGNITSWLWDFGDPSSGGNNTSLLPDPLHSFNTGNAWYKVTLLVTNGNTCHDTISHWVYIHGQLPVDFTYDTACLNQPVFFNGNSGVTMIDSVVSWNWNFGDGTLSVPDPLTTSHVYTVTGTFTTVLSVTDTHGCISTKSHAIQVNPLPVSNFSWDTPVCEGKLVSFTDLSFVPQGYMARWQWDFNDGSTPQTIILPGTPNITHLFPTTSNNFLVKLTVWTNDSCSTFIEKTVNLTPSPIADFTVAPTTCPDQTVHFQDNSQMNGGGILTSWLWNFGDPGSGGPNNTSTLPNPAHVYGSAGNYIVHMTVTNATGCDSAKTDTIAINLLPQAKFITDTACLGDPTTFSDLSIPNAGIGGSIVSYSWLFGDGSSDIVPNPIHTYNGYGVFMVTLTIVNSNGCIKDTTEAILVNPLPIAGFTFTTPSCAGAPVFYTSTSTTPAGYPGTIKRWVWHFGDGSVDQTVLWPASGNISHVFSPPATNHTVRLTVYTDDSCHAYIEHTVTNIPSPLANFTFPSNNCATLPTQFTDQSSPNGGGPIITWWWDFGDPTSGNLNNSTVPDPVHIWMGGLPSYQVTLIVTNGSGCTDTVALTVSVDPLPLASFTADTACLGHLTTFTDVSTGGTITQYYWQFGDGSTNTNANPTHLYPTAGTFYATLTVTTNHGCHKDTVRPVLVIPTPVANFSFSSPTCASIDSVHFIDLSTAPYGAIKRWYWDFGDGKDTNILYPGNANVYHKYLQGGNYPVTLTVKTGDSCENTKINTVNVEWDPLPNFDFDPTRCQHTPVQFNDLSQTNGGTSLASWLWNFGDPGSGSENTSILENPQHTFNTSGTFWVTMMVTNASGCHDTIGDSVSVNKAPTSKFTADTVCLGNITSFADSSIANQGTLIAWLWNFGDPASGTWNTSTLQNPTHTFTGIGNFLVTLEVTNSLTCIADTQKWVRVNPKPVAYFSVSSVCVHDSTQFTDLSIAPGSSLIGWHWDFGDGFSSTIQNPLHTYQSASTFNVTETVTNLQGCRDSVTIPEIVRPAPIAAFTYINFFCPAGQVNFQDESQGQGAVIVSHHWIFEPGWTSDLVNPAHIFSVTDTTYAVMEIVTDSFGCKDTVVDSVIVKPGFSFTFHTDTVCYKQITHFSPVDLAPGDSLYSVLWNFGDPGSGSDNVKHGYNVSHVFSHSSTFEVKMKSWDSDNCVDSLIKEVIVYALPQPVFHYNSNPCDGTLYFHDSTTIAGTGTVASWTWTWGDGSSQTVINAPGPGDATHLYVNVGFYKVVLMVTNTHGCSDTASMEVQRIPCIQAAFTYPDMMLCARYPIAFSDSSLPIAMINRWQWKWGDGSPDTIYFTHDPLLHHTFPAGGTFPVRLIINATVSGTTIADSNTQFLLVRPTPLTYFSNPPVCLNQVTLFGDTSATYGANTIFRKWDFGEPSSRLNDTSTVPNPVHKYDSAGTFYVKLLVINKYGCKDSLMKGTKVNKPVLARFNTSAACIGDPTYFYDNSKAGDTIIGYWLWNFGDPSSKSDSSLLQNPFHIYKSKGNYSIILWVKDLNGCDGTHDSSVAVSETPVSTFTVSQNFNGMAGKLLMNNLSSGADAYSWDFGNGETSTDKNPGVTYEQDGTYIIRLVSFNQYNCTDTAYYKYDVYFTGLYIPNAFSPTNTSIAVKTFLPVGINLKEYHIQVFDTWGNLLWESLALDSQGKPSEGWDGTYKGNLMPQGEYAWKVKAVFINGSIWKGSDIGKGEYKTMGAVTLIR